MPQMSYPDPANFTKNMTKPNESKPAIFEQTRYSKQARQQVDDSMQVGLADEPINDEAPIPANFSPENTSKIARFIQQDRTLLDIANQQKKLIES